MKTIVRKSLMIKINKLRLRNLDNLSVVFFNLRINSFIYCGLFVLILVVFVLFLLHYVSAKFHLWPSSGDLTAISDRNAESCNRIPSNYCLP